MKGFRLNFNQKTINGAVEKGTSGILISNKESVFRLNFGDIDHNGIFHTWFVSDITENDLITISYENIIDISEPQSVRNVYNEEEEDRLLLESYYRIKQELEEEGLI